MTTMKRIHRPTLESARMLSALELNNYRFSGKHTVLTPELLEKMAASAQRKKVASAVGNADYVRQ